MSDTTLKARGTRMRDEIYYPAKIKKIGNGFYISILKEYMESMAADENTEVDVHLKVVARKPKA